MQKPKVGQNWIKSNMALRETHFGYLDRPNSVKRREEKRREKKRRREEEKKRRREEKEGRRKREGKVKVWKLYGFV